MIYFIRAGDTGAVKIGWTKDQSALKGRIAALQVGQPFKLILIRTIEAPRAAEVWLHEFFSALRLAGEWFAYHEDMLTIEPPVEIPKNTPDDLETYAPGPKGYPRYREQALPCSEHIRAGRAFLNWSARELARRVGCAASTISSAERGEGIQNLQMRTLRRIKDTLEAAGVEFITGGNGPGVRPRRQP